MQHVLCTCLLYCSPASSLHHFCIIFASYLRRGLFFGHRTAFTLKEYRTSCTVWRHWSGSKVMALVHWFSIGICSVGYLSDDHYLPGISAVGEPDQMGQWKSGLRARVQRTGRRKYGRLSGRTPELGGRMPQCREAGAEFSPTVICPKFPRLCSVLPFLHSPLFLF